MKRIVILGAGFGGLRAAMLISKKLRSQDLLKKYEVLLVDRNEHHTYTPLLYEVATTSQNSATIAGLHEVATYNLESILLGLAVTLVRGEIKSLDLVHGDIHLLDGRKITFDYAIVALGSETNFFGIKGLEERALTLKTFTDAIKIRDRIINLALDGKTNIKVVIGGGGSTGVELASELKAWCGELEEEIRGCGLQISIVEASPTILMGFDSRVIERVRKRLIEIGVGLIENEAVTEASAKSINLKSGRIVPYDVFIWTGGVKAPNIFAALPLKTERGRVQVESQMQCLPQTPDLKLHGKIYGLGDSICFYDPITKKPIMLVARAALSEATVVASNIIEDIKFEEGSTKKISHKIFKPMDYPYIIPVGGKYAVAKFGPIVISGFLGWILKGLVELNYLLSIMSISRALKTWLKVLRIFIQNDRLG